jgi:peptidoglycan/LPS O-acetylase OafA/YrhL
MLLSAFACWYIAIAVFYAPFQGLANPGSFNLIARYALATFGCCCILLAFLGVSRRVLPAWAIYLGRISYGLYVFHLLALDIALHILRHHVADGIVLVVLEGATGLGITTLLAACSYRFFESPFLRMKKRFEIVESHPV